jgi:hypothetical protein
MTAANLTTFLDSIARTLAMVTDSLNRCFLCVFTRVFPLNSVPSVENAILQEMGPPFSVELLPLCLWPVAAFDVEQERF